MRLSKKDCCCGMNMGRAWGDECDLCPIIGEGKRGIQIWLINFSELEEYKRLCRDGHIITGNGHITNGQNGNDAHANVNLSLSLNGSNGENSSPWGRLPQPDTYLINECVLRPTICGPGGKCVDTVAGYTCDCSPGYVFGKSQTCEGKLILSC